MEWRWLGLPPSVGSIWHLMAVRGSTLGRKQEDAIAALLTQRNVEEAARAAGIGVRTLLRWLKLPEFQSAYRQARRDAFGQAMLLEPGEVLEGDIGDKAVLKKQTRKTTTKRETTQVHETKPDAKT